jgi:hypothetical protein
MTIKIRRVRSDEGPRRLRDSEPSAWGRIIPVMGLDLAD